MSWLAYALISAAAAAVTAILAKVGVEGVVRPRDRDSHARGGGVRMDGGARARPASRAIDDFRSSHYLLALSGVATAVSWLAYFQALRMAPASWVAPIDKLSLPFTIVLAVVLFTKP